MISYVNSLYIQMTYVAGYDIFKDIFGIGIFIMYIITKLKYEQFFT